MKRLLMPVAAVFVVLLAGASGCVSVQSRQYLGVEAFSATNPSTVEILRHPPTRPHLRLGEITVEPQSNTSVTTIEQKFRQAAAKMGANAVVIVSDKTQLLGIQDTGPWYGGDLTPITGRVIVGVAIRYTDQPAAGPAPGQVRAGEEQGAAYAIGVLPPGDPDVRPPRSGGLRLIGTSQQRAERPCADAG